MGTTRRFQKAALYQESWQPMPGIPGWLLHQKEECTALGYSGLYITTCSCHWENKPQVKTVVLSVALTGSLDVSGSKLIYKKTKNPPVLVWDSPGFISVYSWASNSTSPSLFPHSKMLAGWLWRLNEMLYIKYQESSKYGDVTSFPPSSAWLISSQDVP